ATTLYASSWLARRRGAHTRAVALGVAGAYLVARRRSVRFPAFLDAVAPALLVAQAIGRLGNWFNSELFGRPTDLPWALEIAREYRPAGYEQFATFHPTFAYELLWNLLAAALLVWADRRFRLGHGKVFALYVLLYTLGRFWIEALRIDEVTEIGGFRLNNYTSLIVFLAALAWLVWLVRNRPGREEVVEGSPRRQQPDPEVGDGERPLAVGHAAGTEPDEDGVLAAEPTEPVPGDQQRPAGRPGAGHP
ncbi:MAG: prolipoprotein diacylglyceryl transferase family protein, partial [Actinomycetes bacterium]